MKTRGKVLAQYTNGNYRVILFSDGTKVKSTMDPREDVFKPDFPECVDLNITDYCDVGCPFCYMNSTRNGAHAPVADNIKFLKSIPKGCEVALGGGSPITHPELPILLGYLRGRGVVSNITVHHSHLEKYFPTIKKYVDDGWLHGVGVSMNKYDPRILQLVNELGTGVVHVIAGVVDPDDFMKMSREVNILILGYKNKGRAKYDKLPEDVEKNILGIKGYMPIVLNFRKHVVSFDNLALEQLSIKNFVSQEEWNKCYMGDDGMTGEFDSASMYVDIVKHTFARNSVVAKNHNFSESDGTMTDMFHILQKENNEEN